MAMVDSLAAHLSELTGSKFTVLRFGKGSAMRYGLRADRNGQRYFFQHSRFLKYGELTRWLATICDMVVMGFIPIRKERLLVFCGTRKAIERFDMLPGWTVIAGMYPADQKERMIEAFAANPNARLAVDRSMISGWRAPADTLVLFDPSWPFPARDPHTIQAAARVGAALPSLRYDTGLDDAAGAL